MSRCRTRRCPLVEPIPGSSRRSATYQKPLAISPQVLLDRERCVLCQRCTRFSSEISGDCFIDLLERGSNSQIGTAEGEGFTSYFSGNTIQICPVGALTSVQYRFRARPFDLVSSAGVCEHCAAGCAQRVDHRRGQVLRRMAGDDPAVNEAWNCDKGRWAFQYALASDRITQPLVRDTATGELRVSSWTEAFEAAAQGLSAAKAGGGVGVLTGGRLTVEDSYAYAKFARLALGSNDIDFRARPVSDEESDFLAACVVGKADVTYGEVEGSPSVILAGLEPEEECPILFLRLRKACRAGKSRIVALSPFTTPGLAKLDATVIPAAPGDEPSILAESSRIREASAQPGAIILVGERLAEVPGRAVRRRGPGGVDRRPARVGSSSSGRPWRAGSGMPAERTARWPSGAGRRCAGRNWPRCGILRRGSCLRRSGGIPTRSLKQPLPVIWAAWLSRASTPMISPIQWLHWRLWTLSGSWSAARSDLVLSRRERMWSSPWLRSLRRPARMSTGRAGFGPSPRLSRRPGLSTARASCRMRECSMRSRRSWISNSAAAILDRCDGNSLRWRICHSPLIRRPRN